MSTRYFHNERKTRQALDLLAAARVPATEVITTLEAARILEIQPNGVRHLVHRGRLNWLWRGHLDKRDVLAYRDTRKRCANSGKSVRRTARGVISSIIPG